MKTTETSIVYLRDVLGIKEILLPLDSDPSTEVESSAPAESLTSFQLRVGAEAHPILFVQVAEGASDQELFSGDKGEFFDRILQAMNLSRQRVSLMEFGEGVFGASESSSVEKLNELLGVSGWVVVFGEAALDYWNHFSHQNKLNSAQVIASPDLAALIEQPQLKKPLWVQLKRVMEDLGGRP